MFKITLRAYQANQCLCSDTPLIGSGTYAENNYAAVSGTGNGEFFIRYAVAYDIIAQMKYGNLSVAEAANATVHGTLKMAGGEGGVIAVDAAGRGVCSFMLSTVFTAGLKRVFTVSLPFNTTGMYRGFIKEDGIPHVAIFHGQWY